MSAVYSYEAARRRDPMIERISMGIEIIVKELRPEVAAIFSAFPTPLRLPSWLPGMRLKRVSPLAKELATETMESPFAYTERGLATGSISSCMVADHLLKLHESDDDPSCYKKAVKESAAAAFGAGSDTTSVVLMNFILAMILQPDVQEKAHALIESVVGTNRLPTFQDLHPLAIMHAVVESDVYKVTTYPKACEIFILFEPMLISSEGAIITPNVWAMYHNEEKYSNASEFNPDRFLDSDGTLTDDTVSMVWGFGRRICPGRHLAEYSIWSAMVCMLAVFKFSKAKDETGKESRSNHSGVQGLQCDPYHSLAVLLREMQKWI
ncbi:cytochrome P450 [Rhizopogon vinicolor AM-OR11-026]|uniref:Cytochrome P450 n=1 Tax=Rhizopogon vinicolor AM-OR11-026 TaxID=1314800 RepID=A0A1B7MWJ2_9AGAM|nr:cytochrome P450 [Rhizopogon vinicolor AM-OR11-026]